MVVYKCKKSKHSAGQPKWTLRRIDSKKNALKSTEVFLKTAFKDKFFKTAVRNTNYHQIKFFFIKSR